MSVTIAMEQSKEIADKAFKDYYPHSIVSMISGGKDSLCAYLVAKEVKVDISHILHGVTGTGIQETTDFVRSFAATESPIYIEANAGDTYEDYVRRKGFFGRGLIAHEFSYHALKSTIFRKAISKHIRKNKHFRRVLLLNGARREESNNRNYNLYHPVNEDGSNVWVNICGHWTQDERDEFLESRNAPINPVTEKLCRSGECMCGTVQSKANREEASFYFPEWGRWLDDLEMTAKSRFGFGWGDLKPSAREAKKIIASFQPLCVDCFDLLEEDKKIP